MTCVLKRVSGGFLSGADQWGGRVSAGGHPAPSSRACSSVDQASLSALRGDTASLTCPLTSAFILHFWTLHNVNTPANSTQSQRPEPTPSLCDCVCVCVCVQGRQNASKSPITSFHFFLNLTTMRAPVHVIHLTEERLPLA